MIMFVELILYCVSVAIASGTLESWDAVVGLRITWPAANMGYTVKLFDSRAIYRPQRSDKDTVNKASIPRQPFPDAITAFESFEKLALTYLQHKLCPQDKDPATLYDYFGTKLKELLDRTVKRLDSKASQQSVVYAEPLGLEGIAPHKATTNTDGSIVFEFRYRFGWDKPVGRRRAMELEDEMYDLESNVFEWSMRHTFAFVFILAVTLSALIGSFYYMDPNGDFN